MFTGLISSIGLVSGLEALPSGLRLQVDLQDWAYQPEAGASVAVNGCCLTVVKIKQGHAHFDVVQQTCALTTLGGLRAGDRVNLEHAATPETLLGGHMVQGHVDAVGAVLSNGDQPCLGWRLRVSYPEAKNALVVSQGSITIDGVSLTIAACEDSWLEVALIPETLERTILSNREAQDQVNLEFDLIAKLVDRQLSIRDIRA